MKKWLSIIILIILVFSTSGCIESSDKIWGNAPDFTLTTINGENFTLSDHQGKIIVIDLMATWCGPCVLQMPELQKTLEEKRDEIVLVSVDIDKRETSDDVINTFGDYVDNWTFVMDTYEEDVGGKYHADYIPKLVIVNKEGNIYYSESGLTSKEKLIELINGASG
ncbi:MAG: TlpA family protein disulfide reductase [Thermoplasmatales archaeon]|nr:MAG: TlpA family protein disulfide reductase [Thermoplasmatales archaeon]